MVPSTYDEDTRSFANETLLHVSLCITCNKSIQTVCCTRLLVGDMLHLFIKREIVVWLVLPPLA